MQRNIKKNPEDICQSLTLLSVIPGTSGSTWGLLKKDRAALLASRRWDSSLCCSYFAYLWCILNFASHRLCSGTLSWVIFTALQHFLMMGKNTTATKSPPDFLGLSFLNWPFLLHLKGSFRFQFKAL